MVLVGVSGFYWVLIIAFFVIVVVVVVFHAAAAAAATQDASSVFVVAFCSAKDMVWSVSVVVVVVGR